MEADKDTHTRKPNNTTDVLVILCLLKAQPLIGSLSSE